MFARTVFFLLATVIISTANLYGQVTTNRSWRSPVDEAAPRLAAAITPPAGTASGAAGPAIPVAARQTGVLPNDRGQIWREYDISRYTMRISNEKKPQQAIVDWILRETGYEAWHSDTVAMLSADRHALRVYHTPEMQRIVAEIVARYVNSSAERQSYGIRIVTISYPDWRSRAQQLMRPVPVQSQGAQAWLLAKEDAAMLVGQLSKRTDFRSHSSPNMLVSNGQPSVINVNRSRTFVKGLLPPAEGRFVAEPDVGKFVEGLTLEVNPLLSLDGRTIDATVKCQVDQLEKLHAVRLEGAAAASARKGFGVEVPQAVSCRLHERFHWPKDMVLLVSMGIVPRPVAHVKNPLNLPINSTPPRGEALIFVQSKGLAPVSAVGQAGRVVAPIREAYRGRY